MSEFYPPLILPNLDDAVTTVVSAPTAFGVAAVAATPAATPADAAAADATTAAMIPTEFYAFENVALVLCVIPKFQIYH